MKITNRLNLPEAYVLAVQNDKYSKNGADFSVTELLGPPRARALKIKHHDELTDDVADRFWSITGQLGHRLLELANLADLAEKRFFVKIQVGGHEYSFSGQLDSLNIKDGILSDYKFTKAYAFKDGKPPKPDFVAQLNMQKYLLEANGLSASKLQIVASLTDWTPYKAKSEKGYPKAPVIVQPLPVWTSEETEIFIKERIRMHVEALTMLPECGKEDHWGWVRCESYCQASNFCDQYKTKKEVRL